MHGAGEYSACAGGQREGYVREKGEKSKKENEEKANTLSVVEGNDMMKVGGRGDESYERSCLKDNDVLCDYLKAFLSFLLLSQN